MTSSDIFSRVARRRFRDRAMRYDDDSRWLTRMMMAELAERLELTGHQPARVLIIGNESVAAIAGTSLTLYADTGFGGAQRTNGIQCDEDRLPFADDSFDLVLMAGGLDTVNDLPGALILIRRILSVGGLFLGAMAGAGGLETLRSCLARCAVSGQAIARHHPQIDVRAAGDLLTRAGFARAVADGQQITARYATLGRLIEDLRANAMTNALAKRKPLRRDQLAMLARAFNPSVTTKADEIFSLLFLTGWKPQ